MLTQYIVGIGGTAGSSEGLKEFFDHTTFNNATYVIIRHLPLDYKSSLDKILQKHSPLQVLEVKDGSPVLNNKIYYAPPYNDIIISDEHFNLITRTDGKKNAAIDIFLRSLANSENNEKGIAVILSGIGNDGLEGVEALKKAGGLIIVQSPKSCRFPFMPQLIIDHGLADFVLLPGDMPIIIQGYASRPVLPVND
jgi:chemotaxis response regulator CheB